MTREQQMIEMAHNGMRSAEIAREMGVERQTVSTCLYLARRRGELVPYNTGHLVGPLRARLSEEHMDELKRLARERGTLVSTLAREILETVLRDGLVKAVLDEGGEA